MKKVLVIFLALVVFASSAMGQVLKGKNQADTNAAEVQAAWDKLVKEYETGKLPKQDALIGQIIVVITAIQADLTSTQRKAKDWVGLAKTKVGAPQPPSFSTAQLEKALAALKAAQSDLANKGEKGGTPPPLPGKTGWDITQNKKQ